MVGSVGAFVAAKGAVFGGLFLLLWLVFWLAFLVIFTWLSMKKAKEKGYDAWIGFVLGFFLTWVGLIIVVYALPDKRAAKPMSSMGMPGMMPTAPPMGGMAPPPPPAAGPPTAAPTPPPAPPTPPRPGV